MRNILKKKTYKRNQAETTSITTTIMRTKKIIRSGTKFIPDQGKMRKV